MSVCKGDPVFYSCSKIKTMFPRVTWRSCSIKIPAAVTRINVFAEDILDEVSVLTLTSPDETMEEGPQLLLQSPAGPQAGTTSGGTAQKVGCIQHGRRYDDILRIRAFPRPKEPWEGPKPSQTNVPSRWWAP